MTTSSHDKDLALMKANFKESYIDFTPEQLERIDSAPTIDAFNTVAYDVVEEYNIKYYMTVEGLSEGEARMKSRQNRRKAKG